MRPNRSVLGVNDRDLLTLLSLVTLLMVPIHLADDYVLGFDRNVVNSPLGILFLVVWGCGLFALRERFVWVLYMLGFTGAMSAILAARELFTRGAAARDPS